MPTRIRRVEVPDRRAPRADRRRSSGERLEQDRHAGVEARRWRRRAGCRAGHSSPDGRGRGRPPPAGQRRPAHRQPGQPGRLGHPRLGPRDDEEGAQPDHASTSPVTSQGCGRRWSSAASSGMARNMPLINSGWTSVSGPNRSATACRMVPVKSGILPYNQLRRRSSRISSRGSKVWCGGSCRAARCCSAAPNAKQAAEQRASSTASDVTGLPARNEACPIPYAQIHAT